MKPVPTQSPTKIVKMQKSITAREMFLLHPEVKTQLWGREFRLDSNC